MKSRLHGDRPISHPDSDSFGLASFADALATSLLEMSPKDGLVISIEGPWGSGKSSAVALAVRTIKIRVLSSLGEDKDQLDKLAEENLDSRWSEKLKDRQTHILRFNPWNFSGQEKLTQIFFNEVSAQLSIPRPGRFSRWADKGSGYMPSFLAAAATSGGLLTASAIPGIATAAGGIGRALGEIGQKHFSIDQSIEKARQELSDRLREADQRIIIFIDDIDRLMPSEMRSVLSLVKSLGDLPNIIYVLAYDESVVSKSLSNSTEKLDPDFLEKIVQVSLKLPPPWRSELREFFFIRLAAIVGDVTPSDGERWRHMFATVVEPYLETPRDVTRLANTLQVIWPNVAGDVDLADLIVITTLQLFDPDVYHLIRDEIEVITGAEYVYEDDNKLKERVTPASSKKPDVSRAAIALMFPRVARVCNYPLIYHEDDILQRANRRICSKQYYQNYFIFGRAGRMLRRADIEAIVTAPDPAQALAVTLRRLIDESEAGPLSRIPDFLRQIHEVVYAKSLLTPILLMALLDHSDELIRRKDEIWEFYATCNDRRLASIVNLGVSRLDVSEREEVLQILVSHGGGLQMRAQIVEDDARRHGLFRSESRSESERLFPRDRIEVAALSIREQIAEICESGTIWHTPKPVDLIWCWWRMEGDERLKNWIASVLSDDQLIVRFGRELPSRSFRHDSMDGPRVALTFRRESLNKLVDVEILLKRLETMAGSNPEAAAVLKSLRDAEIVDSQ